MTATPAPVIEAVSMRTIPRYRGKPVRHEIRYYRTDPASPGHRSGGILAACVCGTRQVLDGGHTGDELKKYADQHAGVTS